MLDFSIWSKEKTERHKSNHVPEVPKSALLLTRVADELAQMKYLLRDIPHFL